MIGTFLLSLELSSLIGSDAQISELPSGDACKASHVEDDQFSLMQTQARITSKSKHIHNGGSPTWFESEEEYSCADDDPHDCRDLVTGACRNGDPGPTLQRCPVTCGLCRDAHAGAYCHSWYKECQQLLLAAGTGGGRPFSSNDTLTVLEDEMHHEDTKLHAQKKNLAHTIDKQLSAARGHLLRSWAQVKEALQMLQKFDAPESADVKLTEGLQGMADEMHRWHTTHATADEARLLAFYFPRERLALDLDDVFNALQLGPPKRFVSRLTKVASSLMSMSITREDNSTFEYWRNLKLRGSPEAHAATGEAQHSYGKHLHMVDPKDGTQFQTMQDWEIPYMHALADRSFEAVVTAARERAAAVNTTKGNIFDSPGSVRVLEVGWGQGISGRRFLDAARRTGALQDGVWVDYEVIELHPGVARDARAHAKDYPMSKMKVHEGPLQLLLPSLPAENYDIVMFDPYDLSGLTPHSSEAWNEKMFRHLSMHRLLRKGGAMTWYDQRKVEDARSSTQWYKGRFFSETKFYNQMGLHPEKSTSYLDVHQVVKDGMIVQVAIK